MKSKTIGELIRMYCGGGGGGSGGQKKGRNQT